jgi:pimeloyl-ACP methyl ester carboxylesterase
MSTKTLVFLGGRRVEAAFKGKTRERFDRLRDKIAGRPGLQRGTLFLSSVVGLPPFYLVTAICGTLRMPLRHFVVLATTGRAIRFATLMLLPQLFRPAEAKAQTNPPAVRVAGAGGTTYVLLSGLMGGVGGFRQLQDRLVAAGNRVVSIDPYQLAIDSNEVSFEAIARIVDAELRGRGIRRVILVGHSHGGGVALRLAALAADRVDGLFLLDVGALPTNRGAVFGSSIRLVPIIARIPTGKSFIRSRVIAGLRENSGMETWLDDSTGRAYAQPLLDNIDKVVGMAMRLSRADEPEPVEFVVQRIEAPVTIIVGGAPTKAGPTDNEFRAFDRLRSSWRTDTLRFAGHFPHEEAPDDVARLLLRPPRISAAVDR